MSGNKRKQDLLWETRMSRRGFLVSSGVLGAGLGSLSAAETGDAKHPQDSDLKVGLALGAGGASGLAHIPMLETLDEMQIEPNVIAGSSIGTIMGVLYASGYSGSEMREIALELFEADNGWLGGLWDRITSIGLLELLRPGLGEGGLLDAQGVTDFIQDKIQVTRLEELQIPMKVVATDFWKREQVVFEAGEIVPAIKASMAVPGLFAPVSYQGRLLVDGATVNPVPFDTILKECDLSIAVDVSGSRAPDIDGRPSYLDTIFATFEIMQQAIMDEKLKRSAPDIYLRPDIVDVTLMQFGEVQNILEQAEPAREELKTRLSELVAG